MKLLISVMWIVLIACYSFAFTSKAFSHSDHRWQVVAPYNAKLERMAHCESRKKWHINTGNGYYGGLQFDLTTWRTVGGKGYPHQNSVLEQKYRAVKLINLMYKWGQRPYKPWPNCGGA